MLLPPYCCAFLQCKRQGPLPLLRSVHHHTGSPPIHRSRGTVRGSLRLPLSASPLCLPSPPTQLRPGHAVPFLGYVAADPLLLPLPEFPDTRPPNPLAPHPPHGHPNTDAESLELFLHPLASTARPQPPENAPSPLPDTLTPTQAHQSPPHTPR